MKVGEAFARVMKAEGMQILCGYPVNHLIEFAAAENIRPIIVRQERIGLHMADVEKLIRVLHRLVDAGNSVVLIEHNLDVIAEADWIVDMGPEGGDAGGRVVLAAPPEEFLRASAKTHTARALREFMASHGR